MSPTDNLSRCAFRVGLLIESRWGRPARLDRDKFERQRVVLAMAIRGRTSERAFTLTDLEQARLIGKLRRVVLVANRYDLQRPGGQWPLQFARFLPRGRHPDLDLVGCC